MNRKEFLYPAPFSLHLKFRHKIDDQNNCCHSPISVEKTWKTKYWTDRVHAFLIAVSEVNKMKEVE